MGKGKLYVHVKQANDLLAADPDGFSDPYVIAIVGKHSHQTKTESRTLNPIWNEHFEFKFDDHTVENLNFEVYDRDRGRRDDPLGIFKIPLKELPANKHEEERVIKLNATTTGTLTVGLRLEVE